MIDATPRCLIALTTLCATLCATLGGCAVRGTPMAGCPPGVPSPAPVLRLAATPAGAGADGVGTITVVARQFVDGRPPLDHAVIVFADADSAPDVRVVDRTGTASARRPSGDHQVQIRAVGFEAVQTLLRVRADFHDTLLVALRPSPACVQGEYLRVRTAAGLLSRSIP